MALESIQPLSEMSTRNLPGVEGNWSVKSTTSPPSVSGLSGQCENLDVSQPSRPPQFVTGMALSCLAGFNRSMDMQLCQKHSSKEVHVGPSKRVLY
jgi:hypothetical protein